MAIYMAMYGISGIATKRGQPVGSIEEFKCNEGFILTTKKH